MTKNWIVRVYSTNYHSLPRSHRIRHQMDAKCIRASTKAEAERTMMRLYPDLLTGRSHTISLDRR